MQASIVGGQRELQVSLAEKIPLSFFFSSSSSYIRKEKEREYGKGGRRWDLFEGMFVIAYEVGVVTM